MLNENLVCEVKSCPAAQAGKKFQMSRGLVMHYRTQHGSSELGRKAVQRQRQQNSAALADQAVNEAVNEADNGQPAGIGDGGIMIPMSEELLQKESEADRNRILGETNIDQILEGHVGRISSQIAAVQERLEEAQFEMGRLQEELIRATAARKAYAMEHHQQE